MFAQITRQQLVKQISVASYVISPPQQGDNQTTSLLFQAVVADASYVITTVSTQNNQANRLPLKVAVTAASYVITQLQQRTIRLLACL